MTCGQYDYDPSATITPQRKDWDCSAAATAWLGRSLGWGWEELDVAYAFQSLGIATPQLGLLDGTGAGIVRWLSMQPMPATNQRTTLVEILARDWTCPLIMGSSRWYHWVGVRGVDDDGNLQLANSAPGWGAIYQTMTPGQFEYLGDFWTVTPTGQ